MNNRRMYNGLEISEFLDTVIKEANCNPQNILVYEEKTNNLFIFNSEKKLIAKGTLNNKYITYYGSKRYKNNLLQLDSGLMVIV